MPRDHQRTQFASLEADDKPPFTFPPEFKDRPVRKPSPVHWLRVFFIVAGTTATFAFVYLNYGPQLLALFR